MNKPKILIATGGTGGHVFPAQVLASDLVEKGVEVFFAGGGLNTNKFFKQLNYPYREVASATPFKGNPFKALARIVKGTYESYKLLKTFQPLLVIGFGSFYSFPVLLAAYLKRVPIVLFEPNAIAGKVNRLFSRIAVATAIQFPQAEKRLKGTCLRVKMPTTERSKVSREEACDYFYLDPHRFTFLVFGGSQGAQAINEFFSQAVGNITFPRDQFQVIHIAGTTESADRVRGRYETLGIRSCVKSFETRMEKAWSAAHLAICRSGAATVAEQMAFEVPSVYIPYPGATDDHQKGNADHVSHEVQGSVTCLESKLDVDRMRLLLNEVTDSVRLKQMQTALTAFKQKGEEITLCKLIQTLLGVGQ